MTKTSNKKSAGILPTPFLLLLSGSAHRAGISTSAAFDALIGVDYELAIAFGNRVYGALGSASTTADALIGNYVCQS